MNKNLSFLLIGMAAISFGCTMTPKYTRPTPQVPAEWPTGAAYAALPMTTNLPSSSQQNWREFFTDEKLRQVIAMALTNNLDLQVAALNVQRAQGLYGIQRATLLPSVNANAAGNIQQFPADLSNSGNRQTTKRYDVNFGVVSWEIDFFGRIRSLKDEALHNYMATEQARRSAQILLVSSVANTYLALAADRETLTLAQTTFAAQQSTYSMIKRRHDLGLATELDLQRAQTQVDSALGDVARFTQLVAQNENALNLLVGSQSPIALLPMELAGISPMKDISAGVSSEILLRRPDVRQAEDLLKAANADIGAARAAFFPRISLTAAIGTASSDLSGLFKSGSSAWNYAPQIVMPIFDARTWSAHRVAKVQREIAVAQYERVIQSAFKDVADALAVIGTVGQQVAAQQSLVHAVSETYRLSNSRYDKGIDSYLSVLDAQRSLYAAQQGLVSLQLAKLANQVTLYAVLGGGWQNEPAGWRNSRADSQQSQSPN